MNVLNITKNKFRVLCVFKKYESASFKYFWPFVATHLFIFSFTHSLTYCCGCLGTVENKVDAVSESEASSLVKDQDIGLSSETSGTLPCNGSLDPCLCGQVLTMSSQLFLLPSQAGHASGGHELQAKCESASLWTSPALKGQGRQRSTAKGQ
jgi:hypothetical protein